MYFDKVAAGPGAPVSRTDPPPLAVPVGLPVRRGFGARLFLAALLGLPILFLLLFAWTALTTPLSRTAQPQVPPSITLLSAEGTPIARQGPIVDEPVDVGRLPEHVWMPLLAIEDRRFFEHHGVDPLGLARALWRNLAAGGVREGGSTITQQLAKQAFLSSDQSIVRKVREMLMALWLEVRLGKREILSRYLSTAYFGDNVYGLRAAARHYFNRTPERLTVEQAAMLAGLVKAPSRLNPVADLDAARDRTRTVLAAMVDAGVLSEAVARRLPMPQPDPATTRDVPAGTYFADWLFPAARRAAGEDGHASIRTTLEPELQRLAWRAVGAHRLTGAQVALVALRPDGSVAAMIGGRNYRDSPYNRATQARRQPGSAFKLFVYLAALRAGYTPDSIVDDLPITVGEWSPENASGRYYGPVPMRFAFGESSNVAAARIAQAVGIDQVVLAARDLGVASRLEPAPSLALGTSDVSLLELTSAYAAILSGAYPVRPSGLAADLRDRSFGSQRIDQRVQTGMLDFLWASANLGTGRAAALGVPTFGKTGTSQDNRDAWFVGFAGDLVVGVWVGNDDNRPLPGVSGGGVPAQIWHDFMASALRAGAVHVTDSNFRIPSFRYVPSAAHDPRPIVRQAPSQPYWAPDDGAERWRDWSEDDARRERRMARHDRRRQWERFREWMRDRERARERDRKRQRERDDG